MKKNSTQSERAKNVEVGMNLVWSSLQSHLPYTYQKNGLARNESNAFHKKCVKEYVELMNVLLKLY